MDHAHRAPGELIPEICADPTACKDPVISFLPADRPVATYIGHVSHTVDVDVMRDSYPAVPAIGDCRAVVTMVGLEAAQRREEAPREYGGDCVEWDIRNEFEACQCIMVVICVIWMIQNGMTLGTLRIGSMWSDIILMPWTVWN